MFETDRLLAEQVSARIRLLEPFARNKSFTDLFTEQQHPTGTTIFRPGDHSTSFVIVAGGELTLTAEGNPKRYLLIKGDHFGADSLLNPCLHHYTGSINSPEDLKLLRLEDSAFLNFLSAHQAEGELLPVNYNWSKEIREREVRNFTPEELMQREKMMVGVSQVRLFQGLSTSEKEDVVDLLQERQFPKDHIIFNQDEEADGMYLLESGEIAIQMLHDGSVTDLYTFHPGDYFGEMALLSDQPHSARALVLSEQGAITYFLSKENFERFLAENLNVMRPFVNLMSRRLAETSNFANQPH